MFKLTQGDKEYVWNTFLPVIFAVLAFTINPLFLIPCGFFCLFQLKDPEAYESYLSILKAKKERKRAT